jgi:tRNA pseudouridine55 synthase
VPAHPGPCGILLLDKPLGLSSHSATQRVKRLTGAARAGHVGSLDPLATGMLPICLGEATKVAGEILEGAKHYRFTIALGAGTATGDLEGEIVRSAAVPALEAAAVTAALQAFVGPGTQVPPMYSAIKIQGQALYKLARQGKEIDRPARPIQIHELRLLALRGAELDCEVRCAKGLYVRVLAEDIARSLGTEGHVSALRRVAVEPFPEGGMYTLEALQALREAGSMPALVPPDEPIGHLPVAHLDAADEIRMLHGQVVTGLPLAPGLLRLYGHDGRFLGLGITSGDGLVRAKRLFATGG